MAHHFAARHFAGIHLLPVGQSLPRRIFVARVQCIANTREMVAELPKTQRDIEHRHIPQHGHGPANEMQQGKVNAQHHHTGQQHGHEPGQPAVMGLARVKVAAYGHRPGTIASLHQIGPCQRSRLLQQQGDQDGKKTHGFIIPAL